MKQTKIGGQAVIEGVMMRGKKMYAMAVWKTDGTLEVADRKVYRLHAPYHRSALHGQMLLYSEPS